MSALADDPRHLSRWCRRIGLTVTATTLLPRRVYGRYLRETLEEAERDALDTAVLTRLTRTVEAVTHPGLHRALRLHLRHGGRLDADAVVLATGSLAPAPGLCDKARDRHVADPWAPGALNRIKGGDDVMVVGTGLTMLDIATSLTATHPETIVYALSRHGLLPLRHRRPRSSDNATGPSTDALAAGLNTLAPGPVRLRELLRVVRAAVKQEAGDWPAVVESLRPHVPDLWARLSLRERRRFLDLVARYWEIHRHQAPTATADRITALRESGRLRVIRGRLLSANRCAGGVSVIVECGGDRGELRFGWLVSATGPGLDCTATEDPLMTSLFAGGLARPDPLRLGLDADGDGAVLDRSGRTHHPLFALGPPLRGVRYETTAIPEIRAQAATLARRVSAAVSAAPQLGVEVNGRR